MIEQKKIEKDNVKEAFDYELSRPDRKEYYSNTRTLWFNFSGIVLGLKIANGITEKEAKELESYMKKKVVTKILDSDKCFRWFWQKPHKHTKACYREVFKSLNSFEVREK